LQHESESFDYGRLPMRRDRRMIFHVTYMSGPYRVKGYLALPPGYALPEESLSRMIARCSGLPAPLPVVRIADDLRPRPPEAVGDRRWPALIYCRGGIRKVGPVRREWLEQFVRHGHVVFAPSYRGSEGGEGVDRFGGEDREDVLSAFRLLQCLPFVRAERISLMGFSRGAINAAWAAAETREAHRLVLWGGVSDLARTYEERVDLRRMLKRVVGGTPARNPEGYRERSPIAWADRIACPVLIMHGTRDVQVDVGHGLRMHERLKALDKPVELALFDGYGHHLPPRLHQEAVDRMFAWIGGSAE